jgi:hypothetical protein
MSGRKMAGCCVHVAAVIYYLSFAKYASIKSPGEHLNSIFVNIGEKEPSNSPSYVKNSRQIDIHSIKDQPASEKSFGSDRELNQETESVPESETDIETESVSEIETDKETESVDDTINEIIPDFKAHVPLWGGDIMYRNKPVSVTNTCTIDYYLFSLWVLSKIVPNFIENLPNLKHRDKIIEIISNIESLNWNGAKELWILDVMKYNENVKNNTISLFGSEDNRFLQFLSEYQEHALIQSCNISCRENGKVIREDASKIFFKKSQNVIKLYSGYINYCKKCKKKITSQIRFKKNPSFIFIESMHSNIRFYQIPIYLTIAKIKYRLLCATVHKPGHFESIFNINEFLYLIDDLNQSTTYLTKLNSSQSIDKNDNLIFESLKVTVCLYFKM